MIVRTIFIYWLYMAWTMCNINCVKSTLTFAHFVRYHSPRWPTIRTPLPRIGPSLTAVTNETKKKKKKKRNDNGYQWYTRNNNCFFLLNWIYSFLIISKAHYLVAIRVVFSGRCKGISLLVIQVLFEVEERVKEDWSHFTLFQVA